MYSTPLLQLIILDERSNIAIQDIVCRPKNQKSLKTTVWKLLVIVLKDPLQSPIL